MTLYKAEFDVPVLLIIFNRPEYTRRVFESIRKLRPKNLYIAADGLRPGSESDKLDCELARKVTEEVDWECNLQKLFREKNLGCRESVYGALQWFFSKVQEGIILEDDTLPSPLFFRFCKNLLERYRANEKVMMITGTSYFFNQVQPYEDYYFSSFASVWGWASWARSWEKMEIHPPGVDKDLISKTIGHPHFSEFVFRTVSAAVDGSLDTWDAQWAYSIIKNSGLVARPFKNLIKNIGVSGTHSKNNVKNLPWFDMPFGEFDVDLLRHPAEVLLNNKYDQDTFERAMQSGGLYRSMQESKIFKVKRKLRKLLGLWRQ